MGLSGRHQFLHIHFGAVTSKYLMAYSSSRGPSKLKMSLTLGSASMDLALISCRFPCSSDLGNTSSVRAQSNVQSFQPWCPVSPLYFAFPPLSEALQVP